MAFILSQALIDAAHGAASYDDACGAFASDLYKLASLRLGSELTDAQFGQVQRLRSLLPVVNRGTYVVAFEKAWGAIYDAAKGDKAPEMTSAKKPRDRRPVATVADVVFDKTRTGKPAIMFVQDGTTRIIAMNADLGDYRVSVDTYRDAASPTETYVVFHTSGRRLPDGNKVMDKRIVLRAYAAVLINEYRDHVAKLETLRPDHARLGFHKANVEEHATCLRDWDGSVSRTDVYDLDSTVAALLGVVKAVRLAENIAKLEAAETEAQTIGDLYEVAAPEMIFESPPCEMLAPVADSYSRDPNRPFIVLGGAIALNRFATRAEAVAWMTPVRVAAWRNSYGGEMTVLDQSDPPAPDVIAKLSDDDMRAIGNALRSAASRWKEWSESLAFPEVAATFAKQAEEAERYAALFENAESATVTTLAVNAA